MGHRVRVVLFFTGLAYVLFCLASAAFAQQARVQSVYRTFKITNSDVGVACRNGAPPQVSKTGGDKIVVVSCEN